MTFMQILFILAAAATLGCAVMVVSVRKMMHAALWLIGSLFGVAVLFALLEASFFAVAQVLVYIGAISILIIFAIMLTRKVMVDTGPQINRGWIWAALASAGTLLAALGGLAGWSKFGAQAAALPPGDSIAQLGLALVDPNGFVIPFEVASMLLLAALVGAIYIGLDWKGGKS